MMANTKEFGGNEGPCINISYEVPTEQAARPDNGDYATTGWPDNDGDHDYRETQEKITESRRAAQLSLWRHKP